MRDDADDAAVLLHFGQIPLNVRLSLLILPFLGISGEGLALSTEPSMGERVS